MISIPSPASHSISSSCLLHQSCNDYHPTLITIAPPAAASVLPRWAHRQLQERPPQPPNRVWPAPTHDEHHVCLGVSVCAGSDRPADASLRRAASVEREGDRQEAVEMAETGSFAVPFHFRLSARSRGFLTAHFLRFGRRVWDSRPSLDTGGAFAGSAACAAQGRLSVSFRRQGRPGPFSWERSGSVGPELQRRKARRYKTLIVLVLLRV